MTKPLKQSAFEPILVRDGVYLRPAKASDHSEWAALREGSRRHLIEWEQDWAPDDLSASAFRRRLKLFDRDIRKAAGLPLFIFRRDDRALMGGVALSNLRYGASRAGTLGYWVGAPYTRQGYASTAVKAVLAHAFEGIDLNRVEAACQPGNVASQKLLDRCDFRREGLARDYLRINGKWRDHELFAVTAADFRAHAAR